MGATFKYVSEEVLLKKGFVAICQLCDKQGRIYSFQNDVTDQKAKTDYVDECCISCIKQMQFDFYNESSSKGAIQAIVNSHFPKGSKSGKEREQRVNEILNEFQRTPRLPSFVQNEDWPHCCGDYTEYIGEPISSSSHDLDHYLYWDRGVSDELPMGENIYRLVPSEKLAVLGGVSGFYCGACTKHFWTFQCT